MHLILLACFVLLAFGIALYAMSVPQGGATWWAFAATTVFLVLAGMVTESGWFSTILLDLAELTAVALVWSCPAATQATRRYLGSITPAIACTLLAFALANSTSAAMQHFVVALLIIGFALKLGLIPFWFWLPAVAASAPPMTTALIISVVDIASFAELSTIRQLSPWVFLDHAPVWLVIALLSMFGGALLALAQTGLKRMLAFSTIADLGFLLLGLIIGTPMALAGASLGMLSHAVSKVVLFGAVGLAEHRIGRTVTLDTSGLAAQLPLAGAAFIVAALGFIGVPPGFGFAAYWRIYVAATMFGGPVLLAALLLVAALDLLCYARAIHRTWLGPAQLAVSGQSTWLAPGVLAAFAVLIIVSGAAPGLLTVAP